ncbi:FAD-dependent tricarballylate dehydrogenase TcuA [Blastochloris viridis]|uniref:Flavoprotein TcuA n=1 Tax=Blastochloris viridis TaxID=1079 RepID=A0A0H5BQA0_BLAVI|nr:FAD-dependent tricarballylate dehydrogenase TcuA [Blastochloris viridis]ALK09528.1 Fumarate reductase flavoprotein subunit precursor [Blastochloris viridis]BAS00584.1 flavoprotein TcuA [Blastochloris viridis]CUU42191.1 Fumarate reductase flavoprotein subunit precursor [Blastochloris viridis]
MRRDVSCDVLVAGGGIAGLTAAIAARRAGAAVLVVDAAPPALRGGNARHGRNLRLMHAGPTELMPGAYDEAAFLADLDRVTEGAHDAGVASRLIRASADIPAWLAGCGVAFQRPGGSLPPSRKTAYFLGGGKAVVNALYAEAARCGVAVWHEAEVTGLAAEHGLAIEVRRDGQTHAVRPAAAVAAAGGHQSDLAWLARDFGPAAARFAIRGTPFDTGRVLRVLLDLGARPAGAAGRGHLVAVDARGPKFDGGIVTRVEAIPFGLVVDRAGRRLDDESADPARTHFAKWGRLLAERGDAVLILDADGERQAPVAALAPIRAATLAELAGCVGIEPSALVAAAAAFNARADRPAGLIVPPFAAIPMCPGLTFTHFGVAVDQTMQVTMTSGAALPGVFAAGAIMAAAMLGRGYLAGLGLTIAVASGRIAGEAAARLASNGARSQHVGP